jgi:hypothetical protein
MKTDKTPNKIKFQTKLPNEKIILNYAISKDNSKQTDDNFRLFTNWVIENKNKVTSVNIILSDYLHRFYVGEEEASLWGKSWKDKNQKHLNELHKADIPNQLIDWRSLISEENYLQLKPQVNKLYDTDQEFKTTVNGLATSHQNKAGFDSAVQYLLEESAGIASLTEGILTYPSPKLNGAIHCALTKLNCGPIYIGHMFIHSKSSYNPEYALSQAAFKTLCALEQAGYKNLKDKYQFFCEAIRSYEKPNKNNFEFFSNTLAQNNQCYEKLNSFKKGDLEKTFFPNSLVFNVARRGSV